MEIGRDKFSAVSTECTIGASINKYLCSAFVAKLQTKWLQTSAVSYLLSESKRALKIRNWWEEISYWIPECFNSNEDEFTTWFVNLVRLSDGKILWWYFSFTGSNFFIISKTCSRYLGIINDEAPIEQLKDWILKMIRYIMTYFVHSFKTCLDCWIVALCLQ